MLITKNAVVSLTYELTEGGGELIEKTDAPITYLHGGHHGIFPEVEKALEGKKADDQCKVTLKPNDAFGEFDADLIRDEPRSAFPKDIEVGMRFEGQNENSGESAIYTVTQINDTTVSVDGNHPLAGKTVVFSCAVTGVRKASKEELHHGHVHGEGGHHH
ncbi:MAG: peptidylprolyl isomerase [Betaproteobacteria bacterium]|nr:peptidylprolyl isomerase [Betaproteobacteria bacterium]